VKPIGIFDNIHVLEIINSELGDVPEFENVILQYLENEPFTHA